MIHFIGISGIGMSALARVLHQRGFDVQGSSDRATVLTDRLQSEGIRVAVGHAAANVYGAETVVVSSAIAPENAEWVEAKRRGLDIAARGTMLARMMEASKGIAVAGTHGKTTSSAMIAHIFEVAGAAPTWTVGGELIDYETNARSGTGPYFVAESDESDRSFLELHPFAALVTNVENDHVASDEEFAGLEKDFEQFAARVQPSGFLCIGTDDPRAATLASKMRPARTVTFGTGSQIYTMRGCTPRRFAVSFDAWRGKQRLGSIDLQLPGEMNARNALGALAMALEAGIDFEPAAAALASFRGVRRRFDVLAHTGRMTVIDDYAHHPTAVAATIAAARANAAGALVVAFEPHRFTRTKYLSDGFAAALSEADAVFLTPIYAASESAIPGIDARTIGEPLRALGTRVDYVDAVADLPQRLLDAAPDGATVLLMGAGSITRAASDLAALLDAPVPARVRA